MDERAYGCQLVGICYGESGVMYFGLYATAVTMPMLKFPLLLLLLLCVSSVSSF